MTDRTHEPAADVASGMPAAEVAARLPATDVVAWLLAGDEPAVRFATLAGLLGEPPDGPEAAAARRAIMSEGAVPQILAAQSDDGHWEGRDRFYTAKYRGTVWQLIVLAELGADGADERVRRGCEAVLRDSRTSPRAASRSSAPRRPAADATASSSPASPATWSSV